MRKFLLCASTVLLSSMLTVSYAKVNYSNEDVLKFRLTGQCISCDLSGADLGTNHSNSTLTGSNLSNLAGKDINLSNSNLQNTNFSGATLEGANFSKSDLNNANFSGANVAYGNFSGATNADLKNARICYTIMPDGSTSAC